MGVCEALHRDGDGQVPVQGAEPLLEFLDRLGRSTQAAIPGGCGLKKGGTELIIEGKVREHYWSNPHLDPAGSPRSQVATPHPWQGDVTSSLGPPFVKEAYSCWSRLCHTVQLVSGGQDVLGAQHDADGHSLPACGLPHRAPGRIHIHVIPHRQTLWAWALQTASRPAPPPSLLPLRPL